MRALLIENTGAGIRGGEPEIIELVPRKRDPNEELVGRGDVRTRLTEKRSGVTTRDHLSRTQKRTVRTTESC